MTNPGEAWRFVSDGVNIHVDHDPNSTIVGQGQQGDIFMVTDTEDGPVVDGDRGNATGVWHQGTDTRTGVTGWASDGFLDLAS